MPSGVTAPSPVITTRRLLVISQFVKKEKKRGSKLLRYGAKRLVTAFAEKDFVLAPPTHCVQ